MVFFSYRTKRELPAGDQFWTFSRQCSIFGRIGDQWVAFRALGLFLSFDSPVALIFTNVTNLLLYGWIVSIISLQTQTYFHLSLGSAKK